MTDFLSVEQQYHRTKKNLVGKVHEILGICVTKSIVNAI